jgi:hypothetical protein
MNVLVDTSICSLALRRKPEHLNPTEKRAPAPCSIRRQLSDEGDQVPKAPLEQ